MPSSRHEAAASASLPQLPPPRTRLGWRLLLPIGFMLLALVLWASAQNTQEVTPVSTPATLAPPPAPPPPTITAVRSTLESTITARGKLQPRESMDVGLPAAGEIRQLHVEIGETVKEGDLLADIAPTITPARIDISQAELARLKAELANQQAQFEFAELQFQRQTQLKRENATREDTYESSRMAMQSAAARLEAIRAQIRQTELTLQNDETLLSQTHLRAPMNGTIVSLDAHQGQILAGPQTSLLRLANLTTMTAWAQVPEADITRLRIGMGARISTPGYPGRSWGAKLRQVLPAPVRNLLPGDTSVYYYALFDVANPKRELMAGMSAQLQIVLAQARDAILLPEAALLPLTNSPMAAANPESSDTAEAMRQIQVLEKDGSIATRTVHIGLTANGMIEIQQGLVPGEQVILPETLAKTPHALPAR